MAKIIFVNRFFYPDQSATSQILTDLAIFLAEEAHEVHVITSNNMVAGIITQLGRDETISKVRVHRVGRSAVQSPGLISRSLNFVSFYWLAAFQLIKHATDHCIVVIETDPPLLSVWAWWLLRARRVRIINWLQDVYPEVAIRFGVRFHSRPSWAFTHVAARSIPAEGDGQCRPRIAHGRIYREPRRPPSVNTCYPKLGR